MTFYEGLHQHSALMLSLLSSTFTIKENLFKNKSLNSQYFKEQHLVNFKDEATLPHKRLNEIFDKTRNAPMITKAFYVKGMVFQSQLHREMRAKFMNLWKRSSNIVN